MGQKKKIAGKKNRLKKKQNRCSPKCISKSYKVFKLENIYCIQVRHMRMCMSKFNINHMSITCFYCKCLLQPLKKFMCMCRYVMFLPILSQSKIQRQEEPEISFHHHHTQNRSHPLIYKTDGRGKPTGHQSPIGRLPLQWNTALRNLQLVV